MDTSLNRARNLIKLISDRLNNTDEGNNHFSHLEADILLSQLRELYIQIEALKAEPATLKPTTEVHISRPEAEGLTEEMPAPHSEPVDPPIEISAPQSETFKPPVELPSAHSKSIEPPVELPSAHSKSIEPTVEVPSVHSESIGPPLELPASHPESAKPSAEVTVPSNEERAISAEVPETDDNATVKSPSEKVFPMTKETASSVEFSEPVVKEPREEEIHVPVMTFPKVEINETRLETDPSPQNFQINKTAPPKSPTTNTPAISNSGDLFGGPTIADKLKNETPSLNDKITKSRHDQSLADKMQLKPITDLKTAIGINEKFQFVNDLFFGKIELYNEAISNLNSSGSIIHAETLLNNLKSQHNWKEDTEAYAKLKIFVNRRYM